MFGKKLHRNRGEKVNQVKSRLRSEIDAEMVAFICFLLVWVVHCTMASDLAVNFTARQERARGM